MQLAFIHGLLANRGRCVSRNISSLIAMAQLSAQKNLICRENSFHRERTSQSKLQGIITQTECCIFVTKFLHFMCPVRDSGRAITKPESTRGLRGLGPASAGPQRVLKH